MPLVKLTSRLASGHRSRSHTFRRVLFELEITLSRRYPIFIHIDHLASLSTGRIFTQAAVPDGRLYTAAWPPKTLLQP